MKQMKSYRMSDIDLGMIDRIKERTGIETDTQIIREAIKWLYTSIEYDRKPLYLTGEDLLDKS